MAARNNSKPQTFTVKRAKREGRPMSDETIAARKVLSERWAKKSDRATVNVEDAEGKVVDTYSALVVTAEDLGKPATYTGMQGLIGEWAKAAGHAVRVSKITDQHFAIRDKG